mgnify:CR=1 FL=1
MKLRTGENIKKFRKDKDITQEQFAEMLCVSCQSVSRWESGVCYPDIELLPTIAKILGISVDYLLGVNEITENEDVEKYLESFQNAISQGKINECIEIAREGVKEYPNNYVLLDKLMYALFVSGDDDGNIPEWKENMEKYDAEITALGERIMKYCPDLNIRLSATARLAFNHCEHGRTDIGRKIYESLPPMELCRELQIWWALKKEEKLPFLQKAIMESHELLQSFIWLLADADVVAYAGAAWNILMSAELCNNVSRYDGVKYGYRTKNYTNIDELYTNSRTEAFGEFLKSAILFGSETLSTENYKKVYDKALRVRRVIRDNMAALLADCDALLMPAASALAYSRTLVEGDKYLPYKENFFTAPASITGLPAVIAGGVQLVGNAFSEDLLLDLAELV